MSEILKVEELSANEVLSCLWNQTSQERCRIGLVDAVIFQDGFATRWYITGKTGEIVKKRTVDRAAISQRWKRINMQSSSPIIAVVRHRDGSLAFLDESTFDELIDILDHFDHSILSVHCFVKSTQPSFYRNKFEMKDKLGRFITATESYTYRLNVEGKNVNLIHEKDCVFTDIKAQSLRNIMDLATHTVIKYIESILNIKILTLSIDYVVDSKSQLWMIWCSKATYSRAQNLHEAPLTHLPAGDKGRMGWAGSQYALNESLKKPTSSQSLLRKSSMRSNTPTKSSRQRNNIDSDSTKIPMDVKDANTQIQTALSVIDGSYNSNTKGKQKNSNVSLFSLIPDKTHEKTIQDTSGSSNSININTQSLERNSNVSSRRNELPLVFQCKGDFCHFHLKTMGQLSIESALEIHTIDTLFDEKELKILKKYKKFNEMLNEGSIPSGNPGQALVSMKSIILARQDRNIAHKEESKDADWRRYPDSPRGKTQSALRLKSDPLSTTSALSAAIMTPSLSARSKSDMSEISGAEGSVHSFHSESVGNNINRTPSRHKDELIPVTRIDSHDELLAKDREKQNEFSKSMTRYYEQVRVCNVCHNIYTTLDWTRQALGQGDAYGAGIEGGFGTATASASKMTMMSTTGTDSGKKGSRRSMRDTGNGNGTNGNGNGMTGSSSMPYIHNISVTDPSGSSTGFDMSGGHHDPATKSPQGHNASNVSSDDLPSTTRPIKGGRRKQTTSTTDTLMSSTSSMPPPMSSVDTDDSSNRKTWKDFMASKGDLINDKDGDSAARFKDLDGYLRKGAAATITDKKIKQREEKMKNRIEKLKDELNEDNSSSIHNTNANTSTNNGSQYYDSKTFKTNTTTANIENTYRGRVLFACSSSEYAEVAKNILEEAYFDVTDAPDGRVALNEFHEAEGKFDCILVERDLPLFSAYDIVKDVRIFDKKLRARVAAEAASEGKGVQPPSRRVPVICFTAATTAKDLKSYMNADMDGCVSMPVNKSSLLSTIRAAIPQHLAMIAPAPSQQKAPPGAKMYHLGPLGIPEGSLDSTSLATKTLSFASSAEEDCSSNGIVQIDPDTRISYVILDATIKSKTSNSNNTSSNNMNDTPYFNLVICHDLFDTAERLKIFFKPLVLKYIGLQILLWNYAGQAFTEWREEQLLTSEFHTTCLNELLGQVGESGSKEFNTSKPFYLLGYGFGANIASFYTAHFRVPNLRGVLIINGWSFVDSNLAAALHDCISVFQCTPSARPDLPVYFFSRFLFSKEYLAKVSVPLALNLYTAVFNPITIKGRISLCKGALSSMDLRPVLSEIDAPIIYIQSTQDSFSRALHTEPFISSRGGEVRSIHRVLTDPDKTCVIWVKSGHEVFQECRKQIQTLMEQILTGFHEKHDISFPTQAIVDNRSGLQEGFPIQNNPGDESLRINLNKNKFIEDKFIDNILGSGGGSGSQSSSNNTGNNNNKNTESKIKYFIEFDIKLHKKTLASFSLEDQDWCCNEITDKLSITRQNFEVLGLVAGSVIIQSRAWFDNKEDADIAFALLTNDGFFISITKKYGKTNITGIPNISKGNRSKNGKNLKTSAATATATNNTSILEDESPPREFGPEEASNWSNYSKTLQMQDSTKNNSDIQFNNTKSTTNKKSSSSTHKLTSAEEKTSIILDPSIVAFERQDNAVYALNPSEYPEVKEYMSWRLKRNKKRLMRLHTAAKAIQTAYRVHLAKKYVENLRRRRAALTIQRYFRGWLGRCRFLEQARRIWAAQLIQRTWRGYAGRLHALQKRIEIAAAVTVQRRWRAIMAREYVKQLRIRRNIAATKVQSIFRRNQAKKRAWQMRIERNCAIEIQRVYRGRLGRRKALAERDRYIFSKSQTQGIEFGRQMLLEHKLHATRLQSDVALLTQEKVSAEEQVESLLEEISSFEEGVRILEKEMHQLSKVESEAAAYLDEQSKGELREQKMRLDREFGEMLMKIGNRKEQLTTLEDKLSSIDKARQLKEEELRTLERKLVVLLEEQQNELNAIKKKQDVRGVLLAASHQQLMQVTAGDAVDGQGHSNALVPSGGGNGGGGGGGGARNGPSIKERREAAQLMQSTETLMKFGFMSMSMTYFSSLNMIKALRTVSAQDTVMAALSDVHAQRAVNFGTEGGGGQGKSMGSDVLGGALGEGPQAKSAFLPALKAGQLPGQEPLRVSAWSVEDVSRWLQTLALGQYCEAFLDAAIDGEFLYDLNDDDLKNTLGVEHRLHRKKILNCIYRLKIAEAQRDSRVDTILHGQQDPEVPSYMSAIPEDMDNAPLNEQEPGARKAKVDPRLIDGPKVPFPELISLVRHSKYTLVKEALDYLPNKKFERGLIQ
eukprot:gene8252-16970_t